MALSKGLMHPNVLGIEGISSETSMSHYIVHENAQWKTAEGPLAAALKDDLIRSVNLGFKMIAGLSSGMNHLIVQGISLGSLGIENFDILLDIDDRFLISINPPISTVADGSKRQREDSSTLTWELFNALCQKVLRSANRALYNDNIDREAVVLSPSSRSSVFPRLMEPFSTRSYSPRESGPTETFQEPILSDSSRREYVWRIVDRGQQSLNSVANRMTRDLDLRLTSVQQLARMDWKSAHRCAGYNRQEITLATTTGGSAIVSRDAPSPLEICSVCHEVVASHEAFRCICGYSNAIFAEFGAIVIVSELRMSSYVNSAGLIGRTRLPHLRRHMRKPDCRGLIGRTHLP
ncbi:hypothetical protein B0H11DRAFT_2023904 [Mycena galericulata]|nr:hypothetical protein B0H11DRAFT_2023904 [Mycena galericulata]